MKSDHTRGTSGGDIDELAIVDVFIKAIIDPGGAFNSSEKRVLDALRKHKTDLGKASLPAIGEHLDRLSPQLMKHTVLGVKRYL